MSDPFIAEIRIFPFNFAPRGWAFCNGQLLPIAQNTALFSLVGTTYGGNGQTTFGLPNLEGRAPMHPGRGPGLSQRNLGQTGGAETVTLSEDNSASHNHEMRANTIDIGDTNIPSPSTGFAQSGGGTLYQPASNAHLATQALAPMGAGGPHNNMQPYLTLNFNIALSGIYPPRS